MVLYIKPGIICSVNNRVTTQVFWVLELMGQAPKAGSGGLMCGLCLDSHKASPPRSCSITSVERQQHHLSV